MNFLIRKREVGLARAADRAHLRSASLILVRKIAFGVVGFSVLAFGMILIVLPGPSVVVIPMGLAILGKEFAWARRLLGWWKGLIRRAWAVARLRRRR